MKIFSIPSIRTHGTPHAKVIEQIDERAHQGVLIWTARKSTTGTRRAPEIRRPAEVTLALSNPKTRRERFMLKTTRPREIPHRHTRDTLRADGTSICASRATVARRSAVRVDHRGECDRADCAHAGQLRAVCGLNPRVTAAPRCRAPQAAEIVARMGLGYDSIDVPACTAAGHPQEHADGGAPPVATTFCGHEGAVPQTAHQGHDRPRTWAETTRIGHGLTGKTVGSLGSATSERSLSHLRRSTWSRWRDP